MSIEDLQRRVLEYARQATAAGLISENRLAIATCISQPHMHHVLQGKRRLRPEIADAIVRALGIHALDLYTLEELRELIDAAVANTRARMQADLDILAAERKARRAA